MKKFYFTIAACVMAGTISAASYFYIPDVVLRQDQLNTNVWIDVYLHVEEAFGTYDAQFTYEGDMEVTSGVKKNAAAFQLPYVDEFGDDAVVDVSGNLMGNSTEFMGFCATGGYWDPDGDGEYELYGGVKWEASEEDILFVQIRIKPSATFTGGTIAVKSILSSGKDDRGIPIVVGEYVHGPLVTHITVEAPASPVSSITLNQTNAVLTTGDALQLVPTILPVDATNKNVIWTSSDNSVATVDATGLVTAVAAGSATITATTTDGTNLSASCIVTVRNISTTEYFTVGDTEAMHGDTVVIPISMNNVEEVTAFQTDVYLPDGFEIVTEDGDYLVELSDRKSRTHVIMANDAPGGFVRVMSYSSNLKPFSGNEGELFYITVKVPDDGDGVYPIYLRNTRLTTTDGNEIITADATGNVTVYPYLLGDVNDSGEVTIADVVTTARYILFYNPVPFIFGAADVNFDNQITVTDAVRIAYMVLGGTTLNAPWRSPVLAAVEDKMSGWCGMKADGTRTVNIVLDNVIDYTAFQFDLRLPEGMTADNFHLTNRTGSHSLGTATNEDGTIRVLCYSSSLRTIAGNEGAVLSFDVTTAGLIERDITASGIELVTTSGQTVFPEGFSISFAPSSSVTETMATKAIARVDYFNTAGQHMDKPESGITLVVTTYTDGTRTTTKVFK